MREKLNMPFWRQQLREEISPAQVIPDWDLRPPPSPSPDPASFATNQDTGQRYAQTRSPPQKHARPVASGDTGVWNVYRDALALLRRSPLLPKTPAQHCESLFNNGAQVPGPQPVPQT